MKMKRYQLETMVGSEYCGSKEIKNDEDFCWLTLHLIEAADTRVILFCA